MCVAAAVFKRTPYKQFRREWERMLKRWDAGGFHATDFYNGAGPFVRKEPDGGPDRDRQTMFADDSRLIPKMVAKHTSKLFVVSFKREEVFGAVPPRWRKEDFLHKLAAKTLVGSIQFWADDKNYRGRVLYCIENGTDGRSMAHILRRIFDDDERRREARMAAYPTLCDKGTVRGLEAADFLAWHWNKFYVECKAKLQPRRMRRDTSGLLRQVHVANKPVDVRLFTGVALVELLAHDWGIARRPI